MYYDFYDSPVGKLILVENEGRLIRLSFDDETLNSQRKETDFIKDVKKQLDEYFKGIRKTFNIKLDYNGTKFQKDVWKALQKIPYGETRSYKDIAEAVNVPLGCRAVGNANNKNNLLIVVPCHRVINHNGKLGGFGARMDVKIYLLEHEKNML